MRKAWKKAVSVLLTLVLIFGVLPAMNVSAEGEGGQGSRSIELNFAGTVNGSIVTYGVEGTDVALTVEGAELNDSKVSISEGNLGSVKFKLENFDPDKMQIRVYSNDGFQTYLTVNQNETSLAEREGEGGFPDSITLVVEKKGSQGQPGQSTDNRIRLQLEGDACNSFADMVSKDIQIYVSKDGGSSFSQLTGLDTNSTKEYVFEADITSIQFYVSCDETKYSLQFPGKSADEGKSEQTAIALNAAGTQHIQIDHSVRTITWAYDRQTYGEDAYLEHGKAQVVAVEGVYDLYSIPFANNPGDEKGGHIAVEAGKQVTVRLIPDYGYQLKGVSLNGGVTLAPQAEEIGRASCRERVKCDWSSDVCSSDLPSPSQCRIPTCILKESSHRHRMKLIQQEQKFLPPLLKMEQMRLQVEICVLPWRIRMQIQQMHLHR